MNYQRIFTLFLLLFTLKHSYAGNNDQSLIPCTSDAAASVILPVPLGLPVPPVVQTSPRFISTIKKLFSATPLNNQEKKFSKIFLGLSLGLNSVILGALLGQYLIGQKPANDTIKAITAMTTFCTVCSLIWAEDLSQF